MVCILYRCKSSKKVVALQMENKVQPLVDFAALFSSYLTIRGEDLNELLKTTGVNVVLYVAKQVTGTGVEIMKKDCAKKFTKLNGVCM